MTCTPAFSRARLRSRVFVSSSDWFSVLFPFIVIGRVLALGLALRIHSVVNHSIVTVLSLSLQVTLAIDSLSESRIIVTTSHLSSESNNLSKPNFSKSAS